VIGLKQLKHVDATTTAASPLGISQVRHFGFVFGVVAKLFINGLFKGLATSWMCSRNQEALCEFFNWFSPFGDFLLPARSL
jgi:hypothetical protein